MNIPSAALGEIEHLLPSELVAAGALTTARVMAESLPDVMSAYGLEMRLNAPPGQLDLAGAVRQRDGASSAVSQFLHKTASTNGLEEHSWRRLEGFFTDWSNPNSPMHEAISHVWLEYDLGDVPAAVSYPGMFFAFNEKTFWCNEEKAEAVIHQSLQHLLGDSNLAQKRARQLLNLRRELPKGSEIVHLGVMLSRGENSVRMVFRPGSADAVTSFLESVAWRGSMAAIRDTIVAFQPFASPSLVHIEVGDELSSRADVEYRTAGMKREGCHELLNILVRRGLCCPLKQAGLETWIGWSFSEWLQIAPAVIWRTLHHLKLSFKKNRDPIAKAYLWIGAGQDPLEWLAERAMEPSHA